MTILHRHLFKEVFLAMAMASGGFLFVMVAGSLLRGPLADMLGGRMPFSMFLEFCLLLVPSMAPFVLPIGILTGVLVVMGRLSAQNEITAMKASGMSLWRISAPIVAIGLAGTLIAVFVNCEFTPKADREIKIRGANALKQNPLEFITPNTPIDLFPGFLIYVGGREGDKLSDLWIWRLKKTGSLSGPELIRARIAEVRFDRGGQDSEGGRISIACRQVSVERPGDPGDPVGILGADETLVEIPVGEVMRGVGSVERKLRWHTLSELLDLREKVAGVRLSELTRARRPGETDKPREGTTPAEAFADRIKVQLQIQSGVAKAFGILSLTLLAIPLGLRVGRSETFVNFGVALGLALAYYLAMVFMGWIHDPRLRPDLLVWLPNLVIQALAARLLLKAARS